MTLTVHTEYHLTYFYEIEITEIYATEAESKQRFNFLRDRYNILARPYVIEL